ISLAAGNSIADRRGISHPFSQATVETLQQTVVARRTRDADRAVPLSLLPACRRRHLLAPASGPAQASGGAATLERARSSSRTGGGDRFLPAPCRLAGAWEARRPSAGTARTRAPSQTAAPNGSPNTALIIGMIYAAAP